MNTLKDLIQKLRLEKHPEGGYFRENYRSQEIVEAQSLPERFNANRCFSTAIYFLLEGHDFSAFHKIKSDELWHFYQGSPLVIYEIKISGELIEHKLGQNLNEGESFQIVIPAGSWFAAKVIEASSYSLVGCTVAPGFDFNDFEMAKAEELSKTFPKHKELIRSFSKDSV